MIDVEELAASIRSLRDGYWYGNGDAQSALNDVLAVMGVELDD